MTELDFLAAEVRASGRTLRRAAQRGTIRCARPSDRRIVLSRGEYDYVRTHWPLLRGALRVLRTQPNVRLAVLFGSAARGDDRGGSDVDLLVRFGHEDIAVRMGLVEALEREFGRIVQLVTLDEAARSPLLLADVLRDGRVLVDRDGDWPRLEGRRRKLAREAREAEELLQREAWEVLERLEELI